MRESGPAYKSSPPEIILRAAASDGCTPRRIRGGEFSDRDLSSPADSNPRNAPGSNRPECCPAANPAQQEAIHHFEGPCEVIAGPGSGKTFVLVQRILFLIREKSIRPSSILVLTFSRAAAQEMQLRFLSECGPADCDVVFGTFHSVFYHILQESSDHRFTLMSAEDQRTLVGHLTRRHLGREPSSDEVTTVCAMIARTRATGRFPAAGSPEAVRNFRNIYGDYRTWMEENHQIDFEDMIDACGQLLCRNPELLEEWRSRFRFFLVDEFQDINEGQFGVLRLLAGPEENLFVVGDDDQSIYGFRGADPSFMLSFPSIFPAARRIVLEINYRSGAQIVQKSQLIIRENTTRIDKHVRPGREEPGHVHLLEYSSAEEQYRSLCRRIKENAAEEDSAVILRTHIQIRGLIRILEREGIAFRENGNASEKRRAAAPEDREQYAAVAGYWQAACELRQGRLSREGLFRIMNQPERWLLRRDFRSESYSEEELLRVYPPGSREEQALRTLCRDLRLLSRLSPPRAVSYLFRVIGLRPENHSLQSAIERMAAASADPAQMHRTLQKTDVGELLPEQDEAREHGIQLLTMHACKGLEFRRVYLPDLNEGILPNRRMQSDEAIEEERRLLYVAMTRARSDLFLMYIRGDRNNPRLPCRFLLPLGVRPWKDR